jgi:ABC-2 type transport system ATP-binding protein
MDPIIETHQLTKSFRGRAVVDRLDLKIPRGAIFALLGDNGAGKTTTIRMLTGLLRADSGTASILGHDCWAEAATLRPRVGYVPERPRFYDWMSVDEIGWFTAGFYPPGFYHRFQRLAQDFQLDGRARLQDLSKGQYAKVALSLALAPDPEVLILDEPTSGLDLFVRREFLANMVRLAGEERTILISSHQIAEVERVASHVAFLANGRLLMAGTMDEMRQRIVRFRLRFETQPPDPSRLGKVLLRNGTGNLWQAVIQDPDRSAVATLRASEQVFDFEEQPLPLEEMYVAVLGKEGNERKEARS